jgi:hypothetical protein
MNTIQLYQLTNFQVNYFSDQMAVMKNTGFLEDNQFKLAYSRGCKAASADWGIHWRLHTALWAAQNGLRLEGDFVECGVGRGFTSSAIMEAFDWDRTGRKFYLFDTFTGVVEGLCTDAEKNRMEAVFGGVEARNQAHAMYYAENYDKVVANFAEWRNAILVKGMVPDTLTDVETERIAYLHIDMNCVAPEIAAIEFYWPKLTAGACVVLDDYAFDGYDLQYDAWNEWARSNGVAILTLPTGQGLIIKN